MQEDQLKYLIKLMEQQIQITQMISNKMDRIEQTIRELISSNIKYL